MWSCVLLMKVALSMSEMTCLLQQSGLQLHGR